MKVRIVCYNDGHQWILDKFALRLQENLKKFGIDVDIDNIPDTKADINHHINYYGYNGKNNSIDTLMVTHIDNIEKLELLKKQTEVASLAICMSSETMGWLAQMGIDKNKLCYINPAHDHLVKIKKYIIGITCRVQTDGRKRESFINNLANDLDPQYFFFKFMGDSWEPQITCLRKKGFEVEYFDHFITDEYYNLINSLDYYLYMGMDEGQMGFIDAAAAGVKTIVTPQGYHLDAKNGITHPFTTYDELCEIFLKLQCDKLKLVKSVSTWNWSNYALKHIELWKYLLKNEKIKSKFKDGLTSLIAMSKNETPLDNIFIQKERRKLRRAKLLHQFYVTKNTAINRIRINGLSWIFFVILKKLIRVMSNKIK